MNESAPPAGEVAAALIERLRDAAKESLIFAPQYIPDSLYTKAADALARLSAPVPAREWIPVGAIRDIANERQRQIAQEGYTPQHDDDHDGCELSLAAACYAIGSPLPGYWPKGWRFKDDGGGQYSANHRRMLIKAAALIVAEIERLDRAYPSSTSGG